MRDYEKVIYAACGIITLYFTSIAAYKGYNYYKLLSLKEITIEDLNKHPPKSKNDIVCISGIVSLKKPYKSKYNEGYGNVVYSKIRKPFKNPLITGGLFNLIDNKSQIRVAAKENTKICMKPIYTKTKRISSPKFLLKNQPPLFSLIIKFISLFRSKKTTEKAIACGSSITLIGKVAQNLIIPDYIGFSKEIILEKLWKKLKTVGLVTLVIWWLWLGHACKIVQEEWKEWRQKRINQQLGEIPDNYKCIHCLENNRDTINEPCKHMCLCSLCNQNLAHCPVCRHIIGGVTRVYPIEG